MLDKNKIRLGIAPIAWTNDDMPDLGGENTFEQCISEMALAGFTGTELGGKYPQDASILKKALELRGLRVCNCWFSAFLLIKDYEEVEADFMKQAGFMKKVGAQVIGVSEQSYSIQGQSGQPVWEGKHVMDDEEWQKMTYGLNRLGKAAQEIGITLAFHHHMGTVVQTEEEIDRLMRMTDPERVFLLFDSGHLAFAGIDPIPVMTKYIERIRHIHLKDIRREMAERSKKEYWSFLKGVREGVFTVPGDGCVDFESLFHILEQSGYEGYLVVEAEQDPAVADPLEYAIKARKYLAANTGL